MASDSSGFSFKKFELIGFILSLFPGIAGVVRFLLFGGSFEELISWIVTSALIFLALLVLLLLRKVGLVKIANGEAEYPKSDTLAFSLPIYSRADRPSITPEFREKLNKNRKNQISEIKQHLSGGKRGLIITGVKGVGKSTLAAYFAEGDDFWYDFVGKTIDLKTLLIILAQWMGEKGFEGYLQQCATVGENEINQLCEKLSALKRKLFFDNLETLLDKSTRRFKETGVSLFFYKLLKTDHQCRVVITSRIMPVLDEGIEMEHAGSVAKLVLKGLKEEEGAEILKGYKIEYESEDQLRKISRMVDGNPLLLNTLLPLVKKSSAGETITDLEQWRKKYSGEILEAVLMEEAPKSGRELIFSMSVVADPLTIEQVRVLREEEDTNDVVDDLVKRSLLEWDKNRKLFSLHPAVKETAEGELERKPKLLKSARRSAVKMYLEMARDLMPKEEWKSIEDNAPLVRSVELMLDLGEFEKAARLIVDILNEPLFRWGQWYVLDRFYKRIIPRFEKLSKKKRKHRYLYMQILNYYGFIRLSFGDYKEAIGYFENGLKIAKEIGDRQGEGVAYVNLGNAYYSLGDYSKAIEYQENGLEIALEIGDRRGEGNAYGSLGNSYFSLGEFAKAIEFFDKHLKLAEEIGDRRGEAGAYGNLGYAHRALGNYCNAIEFLEKQIKLAEDIRDRHVEGNAYGNLGNAYDSLGDYNKAIEYQEKHLKIALEIGDRRGEGNAYGNLGNAYFSLSDYGKAIEFHEKSLKIVKEIGNRRGEGAVSGNLGNVYRALGDYDKAIKYQKKSLEIALEIGDRQGEGSAYINLGNAYQSLGEYRTAIEYHEKSLEITLEIDDRGGEGNAYGDLGNAYYSLGDYDKAIEYQKKRLEVALEIGDRQGEGNAYNGLGNVYSKLDEHEKALSFFREALSIFEEIGGTLGKAIICGNISRELLFIGNYAEAASNGVKGLMIATEIGVPQAGWLASLTRECREKLGAEEFRSVVFKVVGEEKAEEVERILAELEKREQDAEGEESDG